jgi:hypothetical protein
LEISLKVKPITRNSFVFPPILVKFGLLIQSIDFPPRQNKQNCRFQISNTIFFKTKKMKYKIIIAAVIVSVSAILFFGNNNANANLNGPPAGYTNSPADGQNCARSGCHTGNAVTAVSGWITSNIPGGGYTPGTTYQITAVATYPGKKRFGFQVSPQDLAGNKIGTLVNLNVATQIIAGKWIEQTASGHGGNGSRTWTFNWTAPVSGTGSFSFYGSFNCTDSSGNSSGDRIYTSSLPVTEMPTTGLDCGIFSILSPLATSCDSIITPTVKIQNFGTDTLTTCTINYFLDANSPSSFTWNGSLITGASAVVTLPTMTVTTIGTHTFTATTSAPNASTDLVTNNDSHNVIFNLIFNGSTLPFSQGFEAGTFPPTGWIRNNPDALTTWARNTQAHKTGVASAKLDNYNYNGGFGQHDDLITPALDLSTDPSPNLTFEVAYRLYTNPASSNPQSDTLSVYISTDCQQTWTRIYQKFGVPLTTLTPTFSSAAFTPTAAQWRLESVSLLPYQTCKTAYIKFQNASDYENNLYLDDIYINGPAGISDPASEIATLELYPNPAVDLLNVNYSLKENENVSITIYDIQGKIMTATTPVMQSSGKYVESIDMEDYLPGIYFMHITAGTTVITRKFVVTH